MGFTVVLWASFGLGSLRMIGVSLNLTRLVILTRFARGECTTGIIGVIVELNCGLSVVVLVLPPHRQRGYSLVTLRLWR